MNDYDEMHSKTKGSIGEIETMRYFVRKQIPVFKEFGDNSRVDLVVLIENRPIKIQVKAHKTKSGAVMLSSYKCGPSYKYRYTENDVDVFAVYVLDRDMLLFIACRELLSRKTGMTIRIDQTKNGQTKNVLPVEDYFDFSEALRKNDAFQKLITIQCFDQHVEA